MAFDPSGNWIDAQGHNLGPARWSDNAGGFWYTLNAAQNGFERTPPPPTNVNTDPNGPGGSQTTADPLHPGYWYRSDPNVAAGVQRIDASGNVVGSYENTSPRTQGGSDFNFYATDPATGGPQIIQHPTEEGGLFGLGPVGGSLAAIGLLAAITASAGTLAPALAPAAGAGAAAGTGAAAAGTAAAAAAVPSTLATVGAGATLGSAGLSIASQAAQNADLLRAAQALGLVGAGTGLAAGLSSGLAEGGSLGLSDAARTAQFANRARGFESGFDNAGSAFSGGSGTGTLQGGSGTDTLQGGGGSGMAETTGGTGTLDWINALGPLLTSGIGLAGSGLTLAAMPEVLKRLETLYNQSQGNFQLQTQYAQMYQAMLQHYQQQQQQAFQEQTGQVATDRANTATANEGRAGIAGRLSDPAQVAAGAQAIYQPMSAGMTDNLLRGVQRDLAMRGQSDGGAASRATADAMAPYYNQLQQQAMQNFLASQGGALSAYNPLRGPYSPDPPRPPQPAQLPDPSKYVPGASGGPQADQSGAYKGLSNQVAQLGKLLFGSAATSPGAVGLLTKLFGGGQGSGQADAGTSTEFAGQEANTNLLNSYGASDAVGAGAGNFDYSTIDPAYYDF